MRRPGCLVAAGQRRGELRAGRGAARRRRPDRGLSGERRDNHECRGDCGGLAAGEATSCSLAAALLSLWVMAAGAWRAMITIPVTIRVSVTISPMIPPGLLFSFSLRKTVARRMEISGSAAVMMD